MTDDLEGMDGTSRSERDREVEDDDALSDLIRQARKQLLQDLLEGIRSGCLTSSEKQVLRGMLRGGDYRQSPDGKCRHN